MTLITEPPALKRSNFRADGDGEPGAGEILIASARTRISPRETLTFQLRAKQDNALISAATPLLGLAIRVSQMEHCDDIANLHRRVDNDIQTFETELNGSDFDSATILAARYCLCSLVDEAVMSTAWGAESFWPERPMLSIFHNETWGGEKFFAVLERVMHQSIRFEELLEFLYVCIGIGFEGKFHVMYNGRSKLDRLLDTVYSVIEKNRGEPTNLLSDPVNNVVVAKHSVRDAMPVWLISIIGLASLATIYAVFRLLLDSKISGITQEIQNVL